MYVWVEPSDLSGEELAALQAKHLDEWLKKMDHAFGKKGRTVEALFKLREIGKQSREVWEALLLLSKFDSDGEEDISVGEPTVMKETKPEGYWKTPVGRKGDGRSWRPPKQAQPKLF